MWYSRHPRGKNPPTRHFHPQAYGGPGHEITEAQDRGQSSQEGGKAQDQAESQEEESPRILTAPRESPSSCEESTLKALKIIARGKSRRAGTPPRVRSIPDKANPVRVLHRVTVTGTPHVPPCNPFRVDWFVVSRDPGWRPSAAV